MHSTSRVSIHLSAIRNNFQFFKDICSSSEISAVVKANSYGIGLDNTLPIFRNEFQVKKFFVAREEEGIHLKTQFKSLLKGADITVLNGFYSNPNSFIQHQIIPNINSTEMLDSWLCHTKNMSNIFWLNFDTGMNRFGITLDYTKDLVPQLDQIRSALGSNSTRVAGVNSHMACADDQSHPLNKIQLARFSKIRSYFADYFPDWQFSLANSAACLLSKEYHFDLVRPGLGLYGGIPIEPISDAFEFAKRNIQAVAHLRSKLLQFKKVFPGEVISYGGYYKSDSEQTVGVLGLGYADGLYCLTPNSGAVLHEPSGSLVPILGKICMDAIVIDLSKLEKVDLDDNFQVFGPDRLLYDSSMALSLNQYHMLTTLNGARHHRVVVQ